MLRKCRRGLDKGQEKLLSTGTWGIPLSDSCLVKRNHFINKQQMIQVNIKSNISLDSPSHPPVHQDLCGFFAVGEVLL